MKVKHLCVATALLVMTTAIPQPAEASTSEESANTINTVSELKTECAEAEKDGFASIMERSAILNDVSPEAYEELRTEILGEAAKAAEGISMSDQVEYDEETDTFSMEETVILESGGILLVKLLDEPDTTSITEKDNGLFSWLIEPAYALNKAYGDRKYTATHYVYHYLYPDTKLVLATGYTIGDYGLKTRYSNGAGTYGLGVVSVDYDTWIEDSAATAVGTDINAHGSYNLHFGPVPAIGVTAFTAIFDIRSTIRLNYLNKTNKYADVTQSYVAWRSGGHLL